ncbi:MAG: Holliday junction resolvase-like protein [Nanoarchaeota archaeon]
MDEINVIEILRAISGLRITCSNCDESFTPREAKLFDIRKPYPKYFISTLEREERLYRRQLTSILKSAKETKVKIKLLTKKKSNLKHKKIVRPKQIKVITRTINIGQIIEKILPATNKFKFEPKDCRALLTPIDYLAFTGLSRKNEVEKISFIEVKTGKARLEKSQRQVKDALNSGNLELRTY